VRGKDGLSKRQSRSKSKAADDAAKADKFRRESAADRRRHLGEAVLRCILKNGSAGISVRQIAAEAGVSLGLIRYHFGQFDDLIAYAFDMTTDTFLHAIGAAIERAEPNPQARLDAFIETSFSPLLLDRNVLGVWVVFWGLILHSRRMGSAQTREYSLYLTMVEGLLRDLATAEGISIRDIKLTSIGFTALLDGLWLAWCLNPAAFRPAEGVSLCRMWVEGLRRGAYA
jgi:TetR/AcrR family transcriptional regulator, transcriptional repressor of bet genes